MRRRYQKWAWTLALIATGCGPAQISDEKGYRVVMQLNTAIGARNLDMVAQSEIRIAQSHDAGQLSDDVQAELERIIAIAREGKWEEAHADLLKFQKGQRATN